MNQKIQSVKGISAVSSHNCMHMGKCYILVCVRIFSIKILDDIHTKWVREGLYKTNNCKLSMVTTHIL